MPAPHCDWGAGAQPNLAGSGPMGLRESDIQTGAKPQPLAHDNWYA